MANTNELLGALMTGDFDDDLDLIEKALKERKMERGRTGVTVGSTVRIVNSKSVRPAYLRGLELKVERVNNGTVSGKFVVPETAGRYTAGIRVPFDMVEPA